MSLSIKILLRKNVNENTNEKEIMLDAMQSARDEYYEAAFRRDGYSTKEDVNLDDVLVDGAKEPEKLIKEAESWNAAIDGRLEKEFQKVLHMYEANPNNGFVNALSEACNEGNVVCYNIQKLLSSYDDEVTYGSDYGIISRPYGRLHARMQEEELQEIREHPEKYFTAIISIYGK